MPGKQRITLFGHIERIAHDDERLDALAACYLHAHPDARHWMPGSRASPHVAFWSMFVVDKVYRVGGFGDESAIGWVDMARWTTAGRSSEEQCERACAARQTAWQGARRTSAERFVELFAANGREDVGGLRFQL